MGLLWRDIKDHKLNQEQQEELLKEISLGKISSTVLMSRLLQQVSQLKDKQMSKVLRTLGILIYITSLQHKSKKKEELNSNRNKDFKRKRIKTW